MTQRTEHPPTTLTVKLSTWFEASATGWGVVAVALIVLALLLAAPFTGVDLTAGERGQRS